MQSSCSSKFHDVSQAKDIEMVFAFRTFINQKAFMIFINIKWLINILRRITH